MKLIKLPTVIILSLLFVLCEAKTNEEVQHDKSIQTCLDADRSKQYFSAFGLNKKDQKEFCEKELNQEKYSGVFMDDTEEVKQKKVKENLKKMYGTK